MRVLVYDDDSINVRIYYKVLTKAGYEVVPFAKLGEAIQEVTANGSKYTVALLDWSISQDPPHKNTHDLIKECLRSNIPVIVRTDSKRDRWVDNEFTALSCELGVKESELKVIFNCTQGHRDSKADGLLEDFNNLSEFLLGHSRIEREN